MQDQSHQVPLEELKDKFKTDFQAGLTSEQVLINLQKFGENNYDSDQRPSTLKKLLLQQLTLKYLLLWIGALASFVNYFIDLEDRSNLYNGFIIMMAILSTSIISINADENSNRIYKEYQTQGEKTFEVVRGGVRSLISLREIVAGDIIFIQQGQRIPADCRVLEAQNFSVDNSALTGENMPLQCSSEPTSQNILESRNAIFASTNCSTGNGKCLVTATGKNAFISQICALVTQEDSSSTIDRTEKITLKFCLVSLISTAIVFLLLVFFGNIQVSHSLQIAITLAVITIPITLSAKYKISIYQAFTNIFAANLLVKDLRIFENADSITCICADKTGTLTKNQMKVSHLWQAGNTYKAYDNNGEKTQLYDLKNLDTMILLQASLITCSAEFDLEHVKDKKNIDLEACQIKGSATDKGIFKFLQSIEDVQNSKSRFYFAQMKNGSQAKLAFNSMNKYEFNIIEENTKDSHFTVYFKGAAERLLSFSSFYSVNNIKTKLDDQFREKFNKAIEDFTQKSERVLGFAKLHLSSNEFPKGYIFDFSSQSDLPFKIEDLEFCGLLTMGDEIKPEVKETVERAREMGIKTIMITGDHHLTAAHVAREVSIIPNDLDVNLISTDNSVDWKQSIRQKQAIILGGSTLNQLSQDQSSSIPELASYLEKPYAVFYRMTPANKFQVVEALQLNSEIVASIGDGTNDAPFMKKSNISISMNLQGTDVAKEASQIISLDDKIDSVLTLISEGRNLQVNLRNSLSQYLQLIWIEVAALLAFVALRIPLPLSCFQLLLIQFFSDILPTFTSAYSKPSQAKKSLKTCQKVNPLSIKTLICSVLSLRVILSLLIGFSSYFYTFQYFGFKINSLFGITKITGYLPPLSNINPIQDPFYNENLIKIASDCTQNTETSDKLKFELDWFDSKQKFYDLRKALLKCDIASKKWVPTVEWGICNIDLKKDSLSNQTSCYSTNALFWAQASFFAGILIVYFTSKLFHF